MNNNVDILLSTYNGEKYLPQQLQSLQNQTFKNWHLYVRDDGSTDNTINILKEFIASNRNNTTFIVDNYGNLGPLRSYETLLRHSKAPYIMFCDQDDIWFPDKIEYEMKYMLDAERRSIDKAIVIYSDLNVIDKDGNQIYDSFFKMNGAALRFSNNPYYVFIHNNLVGCTMLLNRQAIKVSLPFGKNAVMHDWWIASVVSLKGVLVHLDKPTVSYRVHEKNTIGINLWTSNSMIYSLISMVFSKKKRSTMFLLYKLSIRQARECCEKCHFSFSIIRYFFEIFKGRIWWRVLGRLIPSVNIRSWQYHYHT